MDIAYYLSELLEQLGEVSVPGLGSFTRVKVNGYYNNDEGRFYPPTSKIEFNQQYVDDDVLVRYIGVKKRISLASSKYFTEKYLTGLRQEIMQKEITLAEVGVLYFENGQVRFRAAEALPDPVFYGYPQIPLNKLGNEPIYNWDEPVTTESIPVAEPERESEPEVEEELMEESPAPVLQDEPAPEEPVAQYEEPVTHDEPAPEQPEALYEEPVAHDEPAQEEPLAEEHNDYFTPQPETIIITPKAEEEDDFIFHSVPADNDVTEEERPRSYKWLWITLLALLIAGGGVFAWFYYQQQQAVPVKKAKAVPTVAPKATTDSISATPTAKDTAVANNGEKVLPIQNAPASTIDSTKRRYEVIGTETKTLAEADKVIANYKSIGLDAHVVSDAPGRRLKISLGTYTTKSEAIAAATALSKAKKVKDAWPLQINPKK